MLSWQAVGLTEGFPATAANRFHKELRFFFSLLKRKKEAKKEKNSRSTCTTRSNITRRLYREFSTYVKSFIFMWKPLHRLTAVPLVLSGPLCPAGISPPRGESPLSGEAACKLANAVFKKLDHLHQKTPEYQHYRYRQGQLAALASPRRTARETSEFRRTVSVRLP